jgi:hypothetical protein
VVTASRLSVPAANVAYGCVDGPIAVVSSGDRLAVVVGGPPDLRAGRSALLEGLMFAAPLDIDGDGRDEIVAAVREQEGGTKLTVKVDVLAPDMTPIASKTAYQLTATDVALIGGQSLATIELLLEITPLAAGEIEVGGVYLHRVAGQLQNVTPLDPSPLEIRRRATASGKTGTETGSAPSMRPPLLTPRRDVDRAPSQP